MIYGYARVSTAKQAKEGNSLEVQEALLKENGAEVESAVGYGESEEYKERFLNRRAVITVAE